MTIDSKKIKKINIEGDIYDIYDETAVHSVEQSDWDEQDELSASYIKNRPFYSQDIYEIGENVIPLTPATSIDGNSLNFNLDGTLLMDTSTQYYVQIMAHNNEESYTFLETFVDPMHSTLFAGVGISIKLFDTSILVMLDENYYVVDETMNYSISINHGANFEYTKQIDIKYLPWEVTVQADAMEGDPGAPSYIHNLPCREYYGESEQWIYDDFTSEISTETENQLIFPNPNSVILEEEISYHLMFYCIGDTEEDFVDEHGIYYDGSDVLEINDISFEFTENNIFVTVNPEIHVLNPNNSYYIMLSQLVWDTVIEKLDPKFLPEGVKPDWNENDPSQPTYIEGRTHWAETTSNTLCSLSNLEFSEYGENPDGVMIYSFTGNNPDFILELGEYYIVNHPEMSVACVAYEYNEGFYSLGDLSILEGGEGSGELILIITDNTGNYTVYRTSPEYIEEIIIDSEKTHIEQLPEMYIPDGIARTYQIPTSASDIGGITQEELESFANNLVNKTDIISIEQGGTNANNRIEAVKNLIELPINTEPAEDTPLAWVEFGNFICYYNNSSNIINKPTSLGTLEQTVHVIDEWISVHQIWKEHGSESGNIYWRTGNAAGWNSSSDISGADAWKSLTSNVSGIISISEGGTGADLSEVPTGAVIAKSSENKLTYWNQVPIDKGGTGTDLSETPNGAIITMGSNGKLTHWNAVPIDHGGTSATTAEGARGNLNAASLDANTFTGNQVLSNAKHLFGTDTNGNTRGLIGISANDNAIIGDSNYPDAPFYLYGNLNLNHALAISEGGTGADTAAKARENLNAASLGANTFTGHQTLANAKYVYGTLADGSPIRLIGVSANNNLLIGDGNLPDEPIYVYGNLNLNHALPVSEGGTGATTPTGIKSSIGVGSMLWNGTWTSGTCTIPNTDDYYIFMVDFVDHATPVLAVRQGDYIRGIGGYSTGSTIETYQFSATRSGNVWTLLYADRLTHTPSSNHTARLSLSIQFIRGII